MEFNIIGFEKKFEPFEVKIKINSEKDLDTLIQLMSIHKEHSQFMAQLKMYKTNK